MLPAQQDGIQDRILAGQGLAGQRSERRAAVPAGQPVCTRHRKMASIVCYRIAALVAVGPTRVVVGLARAAVAGPQWASVGQQLAVVERKRAAAAAAGEQLVVVAGGQLAVVVGEQLAAVVVGEQLAVVAG